MFFCTGAFGCGADPCVWEDCVRACSSGFTLEQTAKGIAEQFQTRWGPIAQLSCNVERLCDVHLLVMGIQDRHRHVWHCVRVRHSRTLRFPYRCWKELLVALRLPTSPTWSKMRVCTSSRFARKLAKEVSSAILRLGWSRKSKTN